MEPAEEKHIKQEHKYLHLMSFLIRSDELLNQNYGRSVIGAERSTLIPIYRVSTIDTNQSRASETRHNDSRPSPQSERKTNQSAGISVRKSNNKRAFLHGIVYRLIPCLQWVWEMIKWHLFVFFACAPTGVLANMFQGRCKRKHDDAKIVPKLLI